MLDPDLKAACTIVYEWCARQGVDYDIVCDEDDIQGILIFKRHQAALPRLAECLAAHLSGLHLERVSVRAGTILLLSLQALNESEIGAAIGEATVNSEFQYRIRDIFDGAAPAHPISPAAAEPVKLRESLMATAHKLRESQYKQPTQSYRRSGSTNIFRRSVTRGHGDGEAIPAGSSEGEPDNIQRQEHLPAIGRSPATGPPVPPPKGGATPRYPEGKRVKREDHTVGEGHLLSMDDLRRFAGNTRREEFNTTLETILTELAPSPTTAAATPPAPPGGAQGLQGMGAEHQPGDLFQRFAQAMQALGQQMHLGAPLQDLLKKQGINWKKSEDGQAIIFFVQNASTNAPQPIARIGYQTLGKPQEFQVQLANMMDFAKGQAPGTEQQKYEEAQEMQKQMRQLANQYAPPQDGQGAPGAGGQPAAVAPAAPTAPVAPPAAPVKPAGPAGPGPVKSAAGPAKPVAKPMGKPAGSMGKPAPGPGPAKPV